MTLKEMDRSSLKLLCRKPKSNFWFIMTILALALVKMILALVFTFVSFFPFMYM